MAGTRYRRHGHGRDPISETGTWQGPDIGDRDMAGTRYRRHGHSRDPISETRSWQGPDIGDTDMAGTRYRRHGHGRGPISETGTWQGLDIGDKLSFWVRTDLSKRGDRLKWCRLLVPSTLTQKAKFEGLVATVMSIKVFLDINRTDW